MELLTRHRAVSLEEGLARIVNALPVKEPPIEKLPIEECLSRILAEDIYSIEDLPGFARSSVDGYAVKSLDTFGASETLPLYLELVKEIKMGEKPELTLSRGKAMKIPTGGMLPEGADAVIMLEHTNMVDERTIEILKSIAPGENVIKHDDDLKRGELVLAKGHKLRPQDIGVLAGLGMTEIKVFKKPVVSIISTGDEIVPPDVKPLKGQVRDINSYNLACLVVETGGIPLKLGIIKDEFELIKKALKSACSMSDMVLISGGSSVGARDYTAEAINQLGSPGVLFHGVMMKPGKPTIGGIVNGIPVFGIPGHPAATTICFLNFVRPVLKIISGQKSPEFPHIIRARVTKNIPSSPGRTDFVRVRLSKTSSTLTPHTEDQTKENDIMYEAEPVFGKSGLITTLVYAHGYVVIPPERLGLEAGEIVEVNLFE